MKDNVVPVLEVIVPVFQGRAWVASCFKSLNAQTLDRFNFRVTFVFNGADDGARGLLVSLLEESPGLDFRILHSDRQGAAAARNHGLVGIEATHITWVDVDDVLSPDYLELLYREIAPGVVPAALLVDLDADGTVHADGPIAQDFLSQQDPRCTPADVPRLLTYMVGKVLPLEWVTESPLSEALESGEDVAFYGSLVLRHDFSLSLWPGVSGAVYYRRKVPGSVSRREPSRDFMVRQRCDVIELLSRALDSSVSAANESVVLGFMNSQASFIRRFLESHPEERRSVMDEITARKIRRFPWRVTVGVPHDLVIAYNFAPYTDTGATIVSKRIREAGRPVDVISNQMGKARESRDENLLLAAPYIAQHHQLSAPTTFGHPKGVKSFVDHGMRVYENLSRAGRSYERMYSRSMWPASHFLAARIKAADPTIVWTAEFSDPVRLTTMGTFRSGDLAGTKLFESFRDLADREGFELLLEDPDLFKWAELLPYLMADRLVFTNDHQLETMTDYAPPEIHDLVRSKAVIAVHPTLPREFYAMGNADAPPAGKINIGYFGDFYSTRGLQEVLQALRSLDRAQQENLCLSVFTSKAPKDLDESSGGDLSHVLRTGPRVSFLDFLATLDTFDVLIVNDAATAEHHIRNPYLPSKLSDYRGARPKIWAIAEPDSPLSRFPADLSSARGDVQGARRVLHDILGHRPTRCPAESRGPAVGV
ncbi:glycosyltransferase [Arthrobacter sp. PM3]|uniref:glycosyltransferase n=1 Tax=Arthrobacter sp. PM3 TaxID=2017685 RepID=UPI000E10C086|nr:glycosyltransferase [Arthrobacter sp. PM3]AXJ11238.1 hypothetical protein CFN17_17700 [Arthrobacter sp. PM3]